MPVEFGGMQVLKAAVPPGFLTPWARNWDQSNESIGPPAIVKYINPSSGVFDWGKFDLFFTNNVGKKIVFTLGQPADWMIDRAALGGANHGGKANMCPTGATELGRYIPAITAIVDRAKTVYGVTGIVWELWNEIEGPGMYKDVQSALGPYAKATAQAIRAVDPAAVVLTPSARDHDTAYLVGDFLSFSDGAGGVGGDWVDGIAFHYYGLNEAWTWKHTCDVYRQFAKVAGFPNLPLYVTESGMLHPTANSGQIIAQRLAVFAALGAKVFIAYGSDSLENPLGAYSAEWNAALLALQGITIDRCVKRADRSVAIYSGASILVFPAS